MNINKICLEIINDFKKTGIDYGNKLYDEIKTKTNNFSENLDFFKLKSIIREDYHDTLLMKLCEMNSNIFLLIVWPVTYNHEQIILNTYNKYGKILYKKEIKLEKNGFKNILHFISDKKTHTWGEKLWFAEPHRYINPLTIYVFETKNMNNINISKKRDYLIKIFNNNREHIYNIEKKGGLNNLYITTKAKRECREILAKNNCVREVKGLKDRNYSHHVNDEHYETIELSRIFFNNNSIFAINNCDITYKCDSFNNKYKRYVKFINNNKWGNINDFCLNNSSILSQFGIRQSRDIDYLHNVDFDISTQIPEDEISSHNYVVKSVNSNIKINELVYNPNNYFWYKNIKFCTLEKLLEFKKQQNNEKAKKDVKLCESMLHNIYKNKYKLIYINVLPQNIVNKYCKSKKMENIKTDTELISNDKIITETIKGYSHYRIVYEDKGLIHKIINFNDTSHEIFYLKQNMINFLKKQLKTTSMIKLL